MKEPLEKAAGWLSHHRSTVLWTFIAGVLLYVLAESDWLKNSPNSVLLALAGLAIVLHFGHCFTRDLPPIEENSKVSAELCSIFRYAYGFLVVAMLLSLFPFLAPQKIFTSSEDLTGVVTGCQRTKDGYGSKLTLCDKHGGGEQWLLQIGSQLNRAKAIDKKALAELAKKAQAACTAPEGWSALDGEFEALGRPDAAGLVAALQGACPTGGAATAEAMVAVLRERGADRDRSELSRGLVVPLYVVVLAVFGGAVGMSRRMPEIQRWAAASTKKEDPDKAISAIEARERVVFQIMQVLAAPLIAVTAFAAFEPGTMTAGRAARFRVGVCVGVDPDEAPAGKRSRGRSRQKVAIRGTGRSRGLIPEGVRYGRTDERRTPCAGGKTPNGPRSRLAS